MNAEDRAVKEEARIGEQIKRLEWERTHLVDSGGYAGLVDEKLAELRVEKRRQRDLWMKPHMERKGIG